MELGLPFSVTSTLLFFLVSCSYSHQTTLMAYPVMLVEPTLKASVETTIDARTKEKKQEPVVVCNLPALIHTTATSSYKVRWLLNTVPMDETTEVYRPNAQNQVYLARDRILDILKERVARDGTISFRCGVSTCQSTDCTHQGPERLSNEFQDTISLTDSRLFVKEGTGFNDLTIFVGAPLIFFCDTSVSEHPDCDMRIRVLAKPRHVKHVCQKQNMVEVDQLCIRPDLSAGQKPFCGLDVSNGVDEKIDIKMKATLDELIEDRETTVDCNVELQQLQDGNVRRTRSIGTAKVTVADASTDATCQIYGDPYITTFDRKTYYQWHGEGEFIAYINTLQETNQKVNAFFSKCPGSDTATCVCGVAVQADDAVFKYSICTAEDINHPIVEMHIYKRKNTMRLKVYKYNDGEMYKIYLPTGTSVQVKIDSKYLINLLITPSAFDKDATEGLCGTWNDDPDDDLKGADGQYWNLHDDKEISDFAKTWRAQNETSIEFGVENINPHHNVYCRCLDGVREECGVGYDFILCNTGEGDDVTDTIDSVLPKPQLSRRKRRDIDEQEVERAYRRFKYDPNFKPRKVDWPTKSGLTLEKAKTICADYFLKSKAAASCGKFMHDSFESEQESCVNDIKLSDSLKWMNSTMDALVGACVARASKYVPTVDVSKPNVTVNITELKKKNPLPGGIRMEEISSVSCLADCNGHGTCNDGVCTCNAGYIGNACEIEKTQTPVPSLAYMTRNGVCDIRRSNCSVGKIHGYNFIKSEDLVCHIQKYDALAGMPIGTNKTTKATFESRSLVSCPHELQFETYLGYIVSVSNNRKDFSEEQFLFLIYDSRTCVDCTIDQKRKKAECTNVLPANGCEINGICYRVYEHDSNDTCKICDPTKTRMGWTINTDLVDCIGQTITDVPSKPTAAPISASPTQHGFSACRNIIIVLAAAFFGDATGLVVY